MMQPLLASLTSGFDCIAPNIKEGLYALGPSLLDVTYKQSISDPTATHRAEDSEEDNFDVVLETAEKVNTPRPILRPQMIGPLLREMRNQCKLAIAQTMTSAYQPNAPPA